MDIFQDYISWKYENHSLISTLVKHQSKTISRYTSVIAVVDYLSDKHEKRSLTEEEEIFFCTGFDYIYDQFEFIKLELEAVFNNDVTKMESCSKTINLALYINDFISELKETNAPKALAKELFDLKDRINQLLQKQENATVEYFGLLNDIIYRIFTARGIDVQTIDQIYYEIAIELGIYPDEDDEFSIYNEILSKQILKHRK